MTSQSAASHAHHPVPTYVATVLWITAMAMLAGSMTLGWPFFELGVVARGRAVFPLVLVTRTYVTKLQDRIIQLEMQVRCARVLPAGQDELLAELSPKQIVALRFASDGELGDLLQRAVKEQMAPAAIKQAVKQWRPDYLRT